MPTIVDREQKRLALVEAAAAAFAETGFHKTRVVDIADRARVGKGTVYEYFSSKEELSLAVFEWINQGIAERLRARLKLETSASLRLAAVCEESAAAISRLRELTSLSLDFWSSCRGGAFEGRFTDLLKELYAEYRELVSAIIQEGQDAGELRADIDPYALGAIVVGAFDGLGIQHWIDRSVNVHDAATAFSKLIGAGLEAKQS